MAGRREPRAPRGLVWLIAAVTVVPLAILLWLGWRLLAQDRALEQQQITQRLERAADLVVGSLQRTVAETHPRLDSKAQLPPGVVIVTRKSGSIEVAPVTSLAYLPAVASLPEVDDRAFERGDDLVFRERAFPAAVAEFNRLARSPIRPIQAGALLRLASVLQEQKHPDRALVAYERLIEFDDVAIAGVPAGLAARYSICRLLETTGSRDRLKARATELLAALRSGRWQLTAPAYALYVTDALRWSETAAGERAMPELLADAVGAWLRQWPDSEPSASTASGAEVFDIGGQAVTAVWQRASDASHVVLMAPRFIQDEWLRPLEPLAREHHVSIAFRSPSGTTIAGEASASPAASRSAAQTALPWTVQVATTAPPPEQGEFAQRRQWLVAGFVVLVLMASAAGLLIIRAVARELAVARHQSDFVAAVSHEFRTPLTALRQFTEMLRSQPAADERRRTLAYDAQARATDRLTHLVESLLDFGRMEAGARTYRFERHDAADLVHRVVDEFRADPVAAMGHDIEMQSGSPVTLDVDDEAMTRAVRNLLENAVKYSPRPTPVEVFAGRQNGHFVISVRDHGLGIPPHERATVFAKFHRGEEARTLGIKGTGIGLAMVKEIVHAHQGSVELESEPGAGSTFTIRLPVTRSDT